ncbi:MAG: hypothetical protein K2W82_19370 [Candidatus Obscuribacterales bacterium]|nr:hypothetical protein [Candidatus Obscuribacterales bacterium]
MLKSSLVSSGIGVIVLCLGIFCFSAISCSAAPLTCLNAPPEQLKSLTSAGTALGLEIESGEATLSKLNGPVLLLEATERVNLTNDQQKLIGEYVRRGGNLILSLGTYPGVSPRQLAFMLPTTAWQTQIHFDRSRPEANSISVKNFDNEIFADKKIELRLPYCFPLRTVAQAERGEGRYERFERDLVDGVAKAKAGEPSWTRPLNNRNWSVRAWADDNTTPFLLTGSYGAGRVAVLGSSALSVEKSPQAADFWRDLLTWLIKNNRRSADNVKMPVLGNPSVHVDRDKRLLHVTVNNPSASPLSLKVIARLLTWEHAFIGDAEKSMTIGPKSSASVDFPLSKLDSSSYQALAVRDIYHIRLGLLSEDGADLLKELPVTVDLRSPIILSAQTDDLNSMRYPFAAPGPQGNLFGARMGFPISAYVYQPGGTVNVRGTIANDCSNIAHLASVFDEVQPDNPSLPMLTDGAASAEKIPADGIKAYGTWVGSEKGNVLRFLFPHPVTINAVTLFGSSNNYRNYPLHNPQAAMIELDGKEVSSCMNLGQRFLGELGHVRIAFPAQKAQEVRVRLPYAKQEPWLGEIEIEGNVGEPTADVKGQLAVKITDLLDDKAVTSLQELSIPAGTVEQFDIPVAVPQREQPTFYRIDLSFAGQSISIPFLSMKPKQTLRPITDIFPSNAAGLGFIVTQGFRNVFDLGTGTQEKVGGWSTPDDLIWAYSRQMKQIRPAAKTEANRLYLTESDMRHYSTPWRAFGNGELFYDIAAPLLLRKVRQDRKWNNSQIVIFDHSDRWDTGPSLDALHGWQDFEQFDSYLRAKGGSGLQGQTRSQITDEIHERHESEWQKFQLDRYRHSTGLLRDTFSGAGKKLVIKAQGMPLLPLDFQKELSETIQGMNQDSTWGMQQENVPLTTGWQLGPLALNPDWKISTLLQWGYNSAILENQHWHSPVGTTEPSRRHYYDRAWRGAVDSDGKYHSIYTYGYSTNAGSSYSMSANDWQEWWKLEERHSLISPTEPYGVGLVVSTSRLADPQTLSFSGTGELNSRLTDVSAVAYSAAQLQKNGISVSFVANIAYLDKWQGDAPLILININHFNSAEIEILKALHARHVRLVAIAGDGPISKAVADLFSVRTDGTALNVVNSKKIGGRTVTVQNETVMITGPADTLTWEELQSLGPVIHKGLNNPIKFPAGTSGYGFYLNNIICVVVEDWLEQGREVVVRLKASPSAKTAKACDLNDHQSLLVSKEGQYWSVALPLRPGDGNVICLQESF